MPILTSIYDRAGNRVPYRYRVPRPLMGGRWPLRDGDTYGIVQRQPPLAFDPKTVELPDNADHQAGYIRSSDER